MGLPTERLHRVRREQRQLRHGRWRTRWGGTDLHPVVHVAGADHDKNRIETVILRQDALENEVQLGRPDSRAADVTHVHPASAQDAQAVRRVEQTLERCRPACRLVEHETLDGTPSRHEDPAESIVATSHVRAALASRVDVESHQRLELRAGFRVHAHLKPAPRAPHVIARAPPEPPARRQLHDHENDRSHNHRTRHPSRHARSPILSRSRLRRSTYGSLRYTNTTHVMANKSTIATPALAIPPRLRTSRPSLNHSSSARTGRKTRYEIVRIWSTWPAGCSKDGSIHHAMNRGPRTMRNNPAIIVSERAILDHLRKISRSSDVRPCVFSRVAIGITTAAIAMMNS